MIAERIQQHTYTSTKYYQFATILEHVIDCFHTIVSDETNPYHPPLGWLTRKQVKPPDDELFFDLIDECSQLCISGNDICNEHNNSSSNIQVSYSVRSRLEKYSDDIRKEIVSRTKDGCSPLFIACRNGHTEIAKYLLDICKANIEQRGRYEALEDHHVHSVSPVWVAAVSGHFEIVQVLIDRGANVNSLSDTGSTPLRSACFLCKDDDCCEQSQYDDESDIYLKIVKLLVDNGADISKPNFNGGTCLINSIHNYKLAEYMLNAGSDINASDHQSKTALHYAIQQGRLEVTELLLSRGADPMLCTNSLNDALKLACISGHIDIFEYIVANIQYPEERLVDAYKLLGSSILELYYDLTKVRQLWLIAMEMQARLAAGNKLNNSRKCDIRRSKAFGDMSEISTIEELQLLSADEFRTQSLIISERILGSNNRETIQRLLYRGTFYISSNQPDRGIDLWIYALNLRLQHDSIFHFESIFAAQALTRLFLDMLGQHQQQLVKFQDVFDVLTLLVGKLDESKKLLDFKPTSCLHDDIFDLLMGTIVTLLFVLKCVPQNHDELCKSKQLMEELVRIDPRTTNNGSSLLHLCLTPSILEGDLHCLILANNAENDDRLTPVLEMIEALLDNGLDVDIADANGHSALQAVCLTNLCNVSDKRLIIKRLIAWGAHVDRRSASQDHDELIKQALRDTGINPLNYMTLACLAAHKVAELRINFEEYSMAQPLREMIAIH